MTDYISRENFLADKRRLYCENCGRRKGTKNGKTKIVYEIGDAPCRSCGIGDVLDDVEEYPAADVAPVVHGKWINAYPNIEPNPMFMYGICSQCRFEQSISDKLNYCPNCGARMDGGETDA